MVVQLSIPPQLIIDVMLMRLRDYWRQAFRINFVLILSRTSETTNQRGVQAVVNESALVSVLIVLS